MENQTIDSGEKLAAVATCGNSNDRGEVQSIHPNVLLVHWEMHSRKGQWLSAFDVAQALVAALPGEPIGWIYRSFALQQLGRVQEAWQNLLTAARRFPADWRMAYNLACYAAQLGDIAGAWNWLDRAMELGDADALKSLALDEPSFKPLWQRTGQPHSPVTESHEQILCA